MASVSFLAIQRREDVLSSSWSAKVGPFAFRGAAAAVRVMTFRVQAPSSSALHSHTRPGRYDHDQQNVEQ